MKSLNQNSDPKSTGGRARKQPICIPCDQVVNFVATLNEERFCEALLCLLEHSPKHPSGAALPGLMTVKDVARYLQKSPDFVRDHVRELGPIRIGEGRGSDLLFARNAVEHYVAKCAERERRRSGESVAS